MTRPLRLTFVGDWGNANFHLIVGWLAAHLRWRSPAGSEFVIQTGTGYRDNLEAVAMGRADLCITTPYDVALEWARNGIHFFHGTSFPWLQTLGWFPQDDRLVFAIRRDLGLNTFEDLRKARYPLRIATSRRDYVNLMGYVVDLVLRLHGLPPEEIVWWGGSFVEHDHPRICLPKVAAGEADAVINEGIMVPQWQQLIDTVPMTFIPMEDEVLARLKNQFGLRPALLPKGRLKAPEDIPCLDWSHWAVVVREDMPEEIAYEITATMVEERAELEARYRHLPAHQSPLTYPIDPTKMSEGAGAPLHSGAERYYREHGYLTGL